MGLANGTDWLTRFRFSLATLRPSSEPAPSAKGAQPTFHSPRPISPKPTHADPNLTIDLRTSIEDALRLLPWAETRRATDKTSCDLVSDTQNSRDQLGLVRLLLSQVSSWGLDRDSDELLEGQLGIRRPDVVFPAAIQRCASLPNLAGPGLGTYRIYDNIARERSRCQSFRSRRTPGRCRRPRRPSGSCTSSASYVSSSTFQVCLHPFSECSRADGQCGIDTERYASQAIVFYASFLADAVGCAFAFPALEVLADYWLDGSGASIFCLSLIYRDLFPPCSAEVQQAARLLFGSYLGAASDARVLALVERWQDLRA